MEEDSAIVGRISCRRIPILNIPCYGNCPIPSSPAVRTSTESCARKLRRLGEDICRNQKSGEKIRSGLDADRHYSFPWLMKKMPARLI